MGTKLTTLSRAASLSIVLLLASTCAQAGGHRDEQRAEQREARAERAERGQQRAEQRAEQRREAEQSELDRKAQQQAVAEAQAEPVRKNGRMTPEERRALRRQIDEAGQNIYRRKN